MQYSTSTSQPSRQPRAVRAAFNRAWVRAKIAERGETQQVELLAYAVTRLGFDTYRVARLYADCAPTDPSDTVAFTKFLLTGQHDA